MINKANILAEQLSEFFVNVKDALEQSGETLKEIENAPANKKDTLQLCHAITQNIRATAELCSAVIDISARLYQLVAEHEIGFGHISTDPKARS
jgi:hypothetical protein